MDHIDKRESFLKLHLSVLLAGFTGLFGKLITLNEVDIVWYRMFFTALILLVFTGLPRVGWKKFLQIAGCGALLGLHWMLFYGSIKMSNVSIGVVCYAMVGFFTAFFEKLTGDRSVRDMIEQGKTADEIKATWPPALEQFKQLRRRYLIYEE